MTNGKWADFIITAVRQSHGVITFVQVSIDNGKNLEEYGTLSKADVIQHLKNKKKIITAYKKTSFSNFIHGSEVVLYQDIHHNDQFKTISNQLSPDNLDNLPKF